MLSFPPLKSVDCSHIVFHLPPSTNLNHHYPFPTKNFKLALTPNLSLSSKFRSSSSNDHSTTFLTADDDDGANSLSESISEGGITIEIENIGQNSRRIRSTIAINASLHTIWKLLTDYEKLADFIPGLSVSQLVEKRDSYARLFQIGQQNLAFGLKFNAKGVVDCYERDLQDLPFGQRRDIEFKMIEGDFQVFEGRWSIEQYSKEESEGSESSPDQEFNTTLLYMVDVKPKMWLPVGLVEGRLCKEIKTNLSCIREEAQKAIQDTFPTQ